MRTNFILLGIILSIVITGCKDQNEQQNVSGTDSYEKHDEAVEPKMHCYLFANGKDSIRLTYKQENDEVEGWMNYDFFEKDGSLGEVEGKFFGDTLKLEYEFMAEGMYSEQEVYFLKKDGKLYRGSGDTKNTSDSTVIYADSKQVRYDDPTPLSHLDNCPENFIKQESIDFYKKNTGRN